MPPKGHAILSASSSDRWLHCPPSARLCEAYEDKGSDYAAEGTDAHALCEYKLRKALGMAVQDPTEHLTWYSAEMEDCANGYAAFILEQIEVAKETCVDPVVLIEQRVDFSRWVEQGFGTADCIIIADGVLRIVDYKHGLGVLVSAEDNSQMKCYALGALELFDDIYDIDSVSMTIYQPRRQNISTFELAKADLYAWADEVLKPTAELAFAGDGNFLCGGVASAKPSMSVAPELKPTFCWPSMISSCLLCWRTARLKSFSPVWTSLFHGHPISRNMPYSRRSAERNGTVGSWSKAAPTANTPMRLPSFR